MPHYDTTLFEGIQGGCRNDYNALTSDIFQTILLNVRTLIHYLSNAIYGCPIKLGTNEEPMWLSMAFV